MMKKECNIVQDVLPLYLENMVSEGTKVFVEEHLESCSDCATELKYLKSGMQNSTTLELQLLEMVIAVSCVCV